MPARREFDGTFQFLHATPVARFLLDDWFSIHQQRAAVHFQEKRVTPGVCDVHPAIVANRRVMLGLAQTLQVKIFHMAGPLRRHLVALQSLPHLPAIQCVFQRTRHECILQKIVSDALHILPAQAQIRHSPRWPARVRLAQKINEALEAVFFLQRPQRH